MDTETREAAARIMAEHHVQQSAMSDRQENLRSIQQRQLSEKLASRRAKKEELEEEPVFDPVFHKNAMESSCNLVFESLMEYRRTIYSRWNDRLRHAASLVMKEPLENKPFEYKYEARGIWLELRHELISFLPAEGEGKNMNQDVVKDEDEHIDVGTAVALMDILIGANYIDCEENGTGQKYIEHALALFTQYLVVASAIKTNAWTKLLPESAHLRYGVPMAAQDGDGSRKLAYLPAYIHATNLLGVLWAERSEFKKSETYLQKSICAYDTIVSLLNKGETPSVRLVDCAIFDYVADVSDVILTETESKQDDEAFIRVLYGTGAEKTPDMFHTLSLFYMGQMCVRREDGKTASMYLYSTLVRQLLVKDFVATEWVSNALGMANYYAGIDDITQADIYIKAAHCILNKYKHTIEEDEQYKRASAEISLAEGRLIIRFLSMSEEAVPPSNELARFPMLELDLDDCRFAPIKNFDMARELFLQAKESFDASSEFFVMDGFVSDHVAIQQEVSQLYKHLANYETDAMRIIAMHKKRLKLLIPLTTDLSEQYFFDIMRQLYFEIGETYSSIVSILMEENEKKPTIKLIRKLIDTVDNGVTHFARFIITFNDRKTGAEPTELSDDDLRPYLMARFNIAHLSGKIIHPDPQEVIKSQAMALKQYRWIVDYADAHPSETEKAFERELQICRDMVTLLPLRLAKMNT